MLNTDLFRLMQGPMIGDFEMVSDKRRWCWPFFQPHFGAKSNNLRKQKAHTLKASVLVNLGNAEKLGWLA